jgi:hypothetical protein
MNSKGVLKPGLSGLIAFLDFLDRQGIDYDLKRDLSDAVSVWFMTVGVKFEVDFFEDHVTYNFYSGNEEVFRDEKQFVQLISESWDIKD